MLELLLLLLGSGVMMLRLGNPSSFPKPLKSEEEEKYVRLWVEEQNLEARNILIERNLRLVAHVMKKYYTIGEDMDDLISIGTIGLIKGINTYRPDKGVRLATYASRCIENAILSQMRLWFRINPPRAKKNTNGVFWHRFPRIFTSFAPLRTAM